MSTAILPLGPLPAATRSTPVASVFLPKEHGSWSLALEPVALGLLVAPSWAGGALAGTVLAGFFARRPFKAAFSPVPSARRLSAHETLVMWSALAVIGLFESGVLASWTALWPLLVALPFAALFVWFDAQNGSRAAAAEMAGSAAFAIVPAAMATLAGWSPGAALVLGGLALTRSVPTVLAVRSSLRRAKGEVAGFTVPVLAAGAAACGVSVLGAFRLAPVAVVLPAWGLFARTLWLASPWRPAWPARRVGMFEAGLGLLYTIALVAAYQAGTHS